VDFKFGILDPSLLPKSFCVVIPNEVRDLQFPCVRKRRPADPSLPLGMTMPNWVTALLRCVSVGVPVWCHLVYLAITPQAIRSPALPAGSLFISSALA
jgi:hypothetical protein